jgi:hypothetical protein
MVRVEQGEFFLSPGFGLECAVGMDGHFVLQEGLIESLNVISTDIHLAVVFQRIQVRKCEEMQLDMIFLEHQVAVKILLAYGLKAQLADIKISCCGFAAHGQFGEDVGEHDAVIIVDVMGTSLNAPG